MSKMIKTNISNAYWCSSKQFEPAENENSRRLGKLSHSYFKFNRDYKDTISKISWFDYLFNGGIQLPEDDEKPLIMLLSGPPGSGKTTLALELCLRVSLVHEFWSLYISTESETSQLIKKAEDLGIKNSMKNVVSFNKDIHNPKSLTIYGQENIKEWKTFSEILKNALEDVTTWLLGSQSKTIKSFLGRFKTIDDVKNYTPDVLVFDNLNLVKREERHDFFENIVKNRYGRTKLIIVILDSSSVSKGHESWEFVCDIIIRLDYKMINLDLTSLRDYYVRQIEVVKARYQQHIWGKHQLKIYTPYEKKGKAFVRTKRAHPYREEGGIFIYPSVHSFLSEYKRQAHTLKINSIATPLKNLNKLIDGLPEGRCTAFMGCRGGHKSHLGYLHLLSRISSDRYPNEAGIIISLRDDEEMTRQHLLRILVEKLISDKGIDKPLSKEKRKNFVKEANNKLESILRGNDLEILYYPPGYITADEFIHRMFMSIYRLKKEKRKITLLFNSLDQIAPRFPLCAHQPIFVPCIIEALSGETVTSIFISVDEPGQPLTQYGLLPMADLILTFQRCKITEEDYFKHHNRIIKDRSSEKKGEFRECILLEISRFAGGQQAGAKGLLELVYSDKPSDSLIKQPGLHFNKWNYSFFPIEQDITKVAN